MKHKRTVLIKSLAILLAVWMLVGCQQNGGWLDEIEEKDDDPPQQTQATQKVVHLTVEKSVEFVSDKTKESWRKPLEKFLAKLIPWGWDFGEDIDRVNTYNCSYAIALMDINLDGTPELILATPGGSACNIDYAAFDLYTEEMLLFFGGGYDEVWENVYDIENDTIKVIGKFGMQMGADYQMQFITQIAYDTEKQQYEQFERFYFSYYTVNPMDPENWYIGTDYRMNNETVAVSDYVSAYNDYVNSHVHIVNTVMKLIDWDEVATEEDSVEQRSKAMAEALLSSGQEFIKPVAKD